MSKIDYDAYLKGLGKIEEVDQVAVIKSYIEKAVFSDRNCDKALKAAYIPEKINDCYEFIKNAVSKLPRKGNSIAVEDTVIFKMARDFYIEILPNLKEEEKKEEPEVKTEVVQETVKETAEQIKEDAKNDNVKRTELGFEVFGEEAEEPEEEQPEEEPCDQGNVVEEDTEKVTEEKAEQPKESEPIRYDKDGQALLFDFM
ncbi:MAG: hypothetical protein J6S67_12460 [Methanobrevibacter sp.]|nr:hypothetical protein [Methanobrevibacter sp.]